jgi:Flp pilus assembly protein TadG
VVKLMIAQGRSRGTGRRRSTEGQTMVEFALIFPLFFVLLLAVIEFAFAFHASLSLAYASRDATLIAAESGNAPGGDCLILQKIEENVAAPADRSRISTVEIFWSDKAGNKVGGAANVYGRTGSMDCKLVDGSTVKLPYTATSTTYPETSRCNIQAGCGNGHAGLDTIGVSVKYDYPWHTPLSGFLNWTGRSGWSFERSNAMRMEPVL